MIKIFVLTGPSGAGKTTAQYVFEECGYFVMENILPIAIDNTLEYICDQNHEDGKYLFISMPAFAKRTYEKIKNFCKDKKDINVFLLTLNCNESTLIERFKLTRHVHPLVILNNTSLSDAIKLDINNINNLSPIADYRIDTTDFKGNDLRKYLFNIIKGKKENNVSLCFMSFGHKYSIPLDVDLVLDTRALPNPYWVESLRSYTGLDQPIIDYFEKLEITKETFDKMVQYLDFYLKKVQEDGRGNYTIGVCCSGGRHRSVYFADQLAKHYKKLYNVTTIHRDMYKDE